MHTFSYLDKHWQGFSLYLYQGSIFEPLEKRERERERAREWDKEEARGRDR